jgi:hypothetical protein
MGQHAEYEQELEKARILLEAVDNRVSGSAELAEERIRVLGLRLKNPLQWLDNAKTALQLSETLPLTSEKSVVLRADAFFNVGMANFDFGKSASSTVENHITALRNALQHLGNAEQLYEGIVSEYDSIKYRRKLSLIYLNSSAASRNLHLRLVAAEDPQRDGKDYFAVSSQYNQEAIALLEELAAKNPAVVDL